MSKVPSHVDLVVWQKAMDLVVMIYGVAKLLPSEERYAMVPQMTRAAVSVTANIAEGKGRGTPREYVQFLRIALGSLRERETYLELIVRLGYVNAGTTAPSVDLISQVGKMLTAMRVSILRQSQYQATPDT